MQPEMEKQRQTDIRHSRGGDLHDNKTRLSLLWIFALLNYLYADVVALFAIAGSRHLFSSDHDVTW